MPCESLRACVGRSSSAAIARICWVVFFWVVVGVVVVVVGVVGVVMVV